MKVAYLIARIFANIDYESKTALCNSFESSDFVREREDLAEQLRVISTERRGIDNMAAWDDEHMCGGDRGDIA
jgi:hypothetical protein